jgi:hypothetical protein
MGIDFLGDKILRLSKYDVPIWYFLVIGDKSGFYYETMEKLTKVGQPITKSNIRTRNDSRVNDGEEWFYRVMPSKLGYQKL